MDHQFYSDMLDVSTIDVRSFSGLALWTAHLVGCVRLSGSPQCTQRKYTKYKVATMDYRI